MTAPKPTPGAVLDTEGWIHAPEGGWTKNPVPGQLVDCLLIKPRPRYHGIYTLPAQPEDFLSPNWMSDGLTWAPHSLFRAYRLARPTPEGESLPCLICGNEERTGPGYLSCGCPYRHATPAAQPEPGAGELEVALKRLRHTMRQLAFTENQSSMDADLRWQDISLALDTLTQAQAKLARLEGEVAEHQRIKNRLLAEGKAYVDRALSAEADAAKVRELLEAVLNASGARPSGYHALNYSDAVANAESFLAAQTERGA